MSNIILPEGPIADSDEEVGYECHKEMAGAIRLMEELTAGPEVKISVAEIFSRFRAVARNRLRGGSAGEFQFHQ